MFEILQELPKCDRNTKLENAVGKMAPVELFNERLSQTFDL